MNNNNSSSSQLTPLSPNQPSSKPIKMAAFVINPIHRLHLKPQSPFLSTPIHPHKPQTNSPKNPKFNPQPPLISRTTARKPYPWRRPAVKSCTSPHEIDMVRTRDGAYAAKAKKVVVLWDLDNKPPRGPPFAAASALRSMAERFGDVVDMSAYANRHAFVHVPQWVVEDRRERRRTDILERKGVLAPSEPYVCSVCGRKCKTNLDLKKHFKQLHERERQKKVNRMRSLKGKKRRRFKERFIDGNEKYNEAARRLLTPKTGYGLARELTRAGVYVKTVQDKPQAADWALKRQMAHSMSRGVDWIVLVSDDSDFSEMLRKAREANLGTVVVGDRDRALGRHADVWVPWIRVENGEIKESDLELKRRDFEEFDESNGSFSVSDFGFESVDDRSLDALVGGLEFNGLRISSFSEGEEEYEDGESDYYLDSDDEGIEEEDDECL